MQVDLVNLTTEWVALSTITTVEDNTNYYIQNRGGGILIGLESSSTPTATKGGILVRPFEVAKYKKGTQNLYLRAYSGQCEVNITSEG